MFEAQGGGSAVIEDRRAGCEREKRRDQERGPGTERQGTRGTCPVALALSPQQGEQVEKWPASPCSWDKLGLTHHAVMSMPGGALQQMLVVRQSTENMATGNI